MKIILTRVEEYKYDPDKELDRLKSCFKGAVLKRQMAIFNAFLKEDWEKVKALYNALPYNSKEGCPEQEFVGVWSSIVYGGWGSGEYLQNESRSVEIIKN